MKQYMDGQEINAKYKPANVPKSVFPKSIPKEKSKIDALASRMGKLEKNIDKCLKDLADLKAGNMKSNLAENL